MKGHMNTQMGEVLIDTDVIAKYAGSVAVECFGIVGMASVNMKDGLVKLLKKDSLTHGISVEPVSYTHLYYARIKVLRTVVEALEARMNR